MNGVTDGSPIVYCEGKRDGPDDLLLKKLLLTDSGCRLLIAPIKGKEGWRKLFETFSDATTYVAIRDRDFDRPPLFDVQQNAQLQPEKDKSNIYLTGLTCVESYVLDPALLHRFFVANFPDKRFPSEEERENNLRTCASDFIPYHAARWSLRDLQTHIRHTDLGVFSLKLPAIKEDCIKEAHMTIETFRSMYEQKHQDTLKEVSTSAFDDLYTGYEAIFLEDDFIQQKRFRAWFDGKVLLNRWHPGAPLGNPNSYLKWAMNSLDFSEHVDLLEFRDICCSLSS